MSLFSEMNDLMNSAIVDCLADAEATLSNGNTVSGLFRDPPAEVFGMVAGSRPSFQALTSLLTSVDQDDQITIAGRLYLVAERRDEQGMTTLTLGGI